MRIKAIHIMVSIVLALTFDNAMLFAQISTVAGGRIEPGLGDDSLATESSLFEPEMVAISNRGTILISDRFHFRIREVDTSGIIRTIAGVDTPGYTGDGGLAIMAAIGEPNGITVDQNDNIYICFSGQNVIRKIDRKGIISTIAGTGEEGFSGDGTLAIKAKIYFPGHITFDLFGNLLFTEEGNHRARKIDKYGIINTIAGNGTDSFSGDGGLAINAGLKIPTGIAADHQGNIYISDYLARNIRKVDKSGIITTIAGSGEEGPSGDGGKAVFAGMTPYAIEVDGKGNIFIGEAWNHVVRKIDSSGFVSTLCGNGTDGFLGDGGDPKSALVNLPCGVALDNKGNLFFGDAQNHRIRKITNVATPKRPLGLEGHYQEKYFMVYPNPSNGALTITTPHALIPQGSVNAVVYDMLGRVVYQNQVSFSNKQASILLNVTDGVYILELTDSEGNASRQRIEIRN